LGGLEVARSEGVRLGAEQHVPHLGEPGLVAGHDRVACSPIVAAGGIGQRRPADLGQHAGKIGIGGDRHPRVPPDQIEHPGWRPDARPVQRQLDFQRAGQTRRLLAHTVDEAETVDHLLQQGQIVLWPARMGHDDRRHFGARPFAYGLHGVASVFIDIHQYMGRRQTPQLAQIHRLGAADLGHLAHRCGRVNAVAGARHEKRRQTQRRGQFGQAGHQTRDAWSRRVAAIDHRRHAAAARADIRERRCRSDVNAGSTKLSRHCVPAIDPELENNNFGC
jgi:hypothetical protein